MSSSILVDQLRKRVDEIRTEHETARQRTIEAKAVEDALAADLAGYQRALDAELKRSAGAVGREQVTAIRDQEEAQSAITSAVIGGSPPLNKTEMIEAMIRSRLDGMTPPEIFHEFKRNRIAVHRNYIYAVLGRLEGRDRIQSRNGRYVAMPQRTNTAEGKLFKVG